MTFEQALHEWHEFFFMVGTSGATLMALLFVAVSLGTGFLTAERAAGTRTFFSPVVLHFAGGFFVSAVGLGPGHQVTYSVNKKHAGEMNHYWTEEGPCPRRA